MLRTRGQSTALWQLIPSALAVLVFAGACSSGGAMLLSKLDPVTSVTISYSSSPMVFYRDVDGRAAYARDYVHLAPVEVNRSGSYRYYLWLGIWNTMQTAPVDVARAGFESIVIFADGEPLPLEVAGWTPAAIGASEPVLLKPVASATDAYYAVNVDALRLLAQARDVRLQTTGQRAVAYEPWDDQSPAKKGLLEFLQAAVY